MLSASTRQIVSREKKSKKLKSNLWEFRISGSAYFPLVKTGLRTGRVLCSSGVNWNM